VSPANRVDIGSPDGRLSYFASSLAGVGDINGDGYADFLVSATGANSRAGVAHFYQGGALLDPADWNGTAPNKRVDFLNPDGPGALNAGARFSNVQ
jgi:hypothetical protein